MYHATRHRGMTSGSGGTITVTGTLEEQGDDRELPFSCDLTWGFVKQANGLIVMVAELWRVKL